MKRIILNICYAIIESLQEVEKIDKTDHRTNKKYSQSGFRGVAKRGDKFQSAIDIKHGRKSFQYYLGMFDTAQEAADARIKFLESLK